MHGAISRWVNRTAPGRALQCGTSRGAATLCSPPEVAPGGGNRRYSSVTVNGPRLSKVMRRENDARIKYQQRLQAEIRIVGGAGKQPMGTLPFCVNPRWCQLNCFPIMPFSINSHSGRISSNTTFCLMRFEGLRGNELNGAKRRQFVLICAHTRQEEAGPFTSFLLSLCFFCSFLIIAHH